jgi:hypothetical protein
MTLGAPINVAQLSIVRENMFRRKSLESSIDAIRYRLTPHMVEYDNLLHRSRIKWLPFVMFFHPAGYNSPVVNTDSLGFRLSSRGSKRYSPADGCDEEPINLLIGGSVVFGLGATGDSATIASRLNDSRPTDGVWLNMGGRGFTSTQELIMFLLIHPRIKNIKRIVILSGVNNLVLSGFIDDESKEFGSFFYSEVFFEKMYESNNDQQREKTSFFKDIDARIMVATDILKRDLSHWAIVAKAIGAELLFALQPLGSWPKRELNECEVELFDALDRHPSNSLHLIGSLLAQPVGEKYSRAMRHVCSEMGIDFLDLSLELSRRHCDNKWLFVDRAHFTDEGYRLLADIINSKINCTGNEKQRNVSSFNI